MVTYEEETIEQVVLINKFKETLLNVLDSIHILSY